MSSKRIHLKQLENNVQDNMKKLHAVRNKSRYWRHSERVWVWIGEALGGFMEEGCFGQVAQPQ